MANIGKWNTPRGITTVMSTEMFNQANNTMATSATAYDNTGNLDIYADIELFLPPMSPTSGAYVSIYIAEALDGVTFANPAAADMRLATTQLLCVFPIGTTASTQQRTTVRNVVLPPFKFNVWVDNQTGAGFSTSTSTFPTLKFNTYNYNLNG